MLTQIKKMITKKTDSYKEEEDVYPKSMYDFRDNILKQPVIKIIFAGVAIIGGVYLLGLTAKILAGALGSLRDLKDSYKRFNI